MQITLNGEPREIAANATVALLLDELQEKARQAGTLPADDPPAAPRSGAVRSAATRHVATRYVAVEVNFEVIPRERHAETVLHEGDQVEVVTLVGGG